MRALPRTALLLTIAALPLAAQERPLPDLATLLPRTREHLRDDWRLDRHYSYFERRTEYAPGDDGHERVKSVKLFEVRPTAGGRAFRRLVEVNGRRRTPEELAHDERDYQRRVAERQAESPAERARRREREAARQREEQEAWDDLSRVYSFTIAGRQQIDGQPLVIVDFSPKPDARPLTDNGRRMTKVKGRAWISESDYQVARVDAEVLDDISIGWGLLGKLYAGARASYVRRRVDGEQWLPQQLAFSANGRALVKRFALHQVIEYFDYRKSE